MSENDVAKWTLVGISVPIITHGVIASLGFTSLGVALGSPAAGMQVAEVIAGSAFSIAQSYGATGVLLSPPVLIAGAIVGASIG